MIACYECHAACAHCMYGCSPDLPPDYMTVETAGYLCDKILRLGCRSLHIGGGEPFLDPDNLALLIKTMDRGGVSVDYVETNAAWITEDAKRDRETLNKIIKTGGNCIMVSADLFHIEFIPFRKTKTLIDLLNRGGINHFIWQQRFLPVLEKLDPDKLYDREALINELGYDAQAQCAREYGMGFNVRALKIIRRMGNRKPASDFIIDKPCENLLRANHFHVDLYGRYIPPGCTGMGIDIDDLGKPLDEEKYHVFSRLYSGGLKELYEYALSQGFEPDAKGYASKCDLCFSIRKYFVKKDEASYTDLVPNWYYYQDF